LTSTSAIRTWPAAHRPDATRWPSTMPRSDTLTRGAKSTALQRILSDLRSSENQQEQGYNRRGSTWFPPRASRPSSATWAPASPGIEHPA
jgi:hypothetical protein